MTQINEQEQAALAILRKTGLGALEAAMIAWEASRAVKGRGDRLKRIRRCMELGTSALRAEHRTSTFSKAVRAAQEERRARRARTQADFRYICRRLLRRCPGLASRRLCDISAEECARYLECAFDTPRQRLKGRAIMSGVFSTAVARGWCDENPLLRVHFPSMVEQRIPILTREEIRRLLQAAVLYREGVCLPAVGLMLYAGVRPNEVCRLSWGEIDLVHGAVCVMPCHSKTGGARRVTIHPPLRRILAARPRHDSLMVCPPNWGARWRELRCQAGFPHWVPDILRHTFASYHLCYFRSYAELQMETGHRDTSLLRTRYVNMKGVVDAAGFWAGEDVEGLCLPGEVLREAPKGKGCEVSERSFLKGGSAEGGGSGGGDTGTEGQLFRGRK